MVLNYSNQPNIELLKASQNSIAAAAAAFVHNYSQFNYSTN